MAVTPEQAVDAANAYFGRHAGARSLHAKGLLLKGTFVASSDATALSRAAHMQGAEIAVTARFSNGSGNPGHPDYAPDPRGLAVKFYLPDGGRTDIVAVSTPKFLTKTPDGFVELLKAQASGAAAAWKVPLVFGRHPEALRGLPAIAPSLRPPSSYAVIPYYGIHAFKWIDGSGGERFVRYTWLPEASGSRLSPLAARRQARDFLSVELLERLARGPVRFALEVQLAAADDPVNDPSASWPRSRRRVRVGTLSLTERELGREVDGDVLVFDPTRVTDGIELSDDPVLRFRAAAYSVSVARRTGG